MCLYNLKFPIPKIKYAYKVFRQFKNNKIESIYYNNNKFTINEWKTDFVNAYLRTHGCYSDYKSGFHCFTNKKEAIKYLKNLENPFINSKLIIYKVEIDKIVAYGVEHYSFNSEYTNIIVCNQIKLLKEIKCV